MKKIIEKDAETKVIIKSRNGMKKGDSPKVPIKEAIALANLQKGVNATKLQKSGIDTETINELVNASVAYLKKTMLSRANNATKLQIALDITKKAMPKDIVLSDGQKGNSFIQAIKDLHKGNL